MSPSRKSEAVAKPKAVEQVDGKAGSRARPYASGKTRRQVRVDVRGRYERYMRRLLEHEDRLASPTDDNPYGGLSRTQLEKRFARPRVHPLLQPLVDELKVWQRPAALEGIACAFETWGRPSTRRRPRSPETKAVLVRMYKLRRQGIGAKKAAEVVASERVGAAGASSADQAKCATAIYRLWLRRPRPALSDGSTG